jgi:hypothetical protein
MPKKKLGEPTSTSVIYIGQQRYQLLAKHAREISYLSNTNIKITTFLHYLIDEFTKKAMPHCLTSCRRLPPLKRNKPSNRRRNDFIRRASDSGHAMRPNHSPGYIA